MSNCIKLEILANTDQIITTQFNMKSIQLQRYGKPETTCACIEIDDLKTPASGEVNVQIKASAINPADLLIFEDRYPGPESLPAFVGIEGAGEVIAVGAGVTELKAGDHVMSLGRANWAERVNGPAEQFIPIPAELAWQDAAQLKANPPSAELMLSQYENLQAGDWVIQNAANSAVGRHVIRFCKARGINSINVVRRLELIPELEKLGGNMVVVDSDDLGARVRAELGADAKVKLGIDALGGSATSRLADCLSEGGTIVNYGFLAGEPCQMTPTHTIVKGLTLRGFWLVGYMRSTPRDEIVEMYQKMSRAFISGEISVPVEAEYKLDEIAQALEHANRPQRNGKVLLVP